MSVLGSETGDLVLAQVLGLGETETMKIPRVRHRPWKPAHGSPWRTPRPSAWFPSLVDFIGPAYIRWGLGLDRVTVTGGSNLAQAIQGTRTQGDRVVVVFRHCGDADPQGLWYALNSVAKPHYRGLGKRPRFLFLASAEIALWGGPVVDLALRASGSLPLAHGVGSRPSLDFLKGHFRASPHPVVLAPEGQITYELDGPIKLDPGAANMALWAAEAATGTARLVPLGLRYRCPRETWKRWGRFVTDLEKGIGLPIWSGGPAAPDTAADRLGRIWDHLLSRGELYYQTKHRREFSALDSRDQRCRRLCQTAVDVASSVRGVPATGEVRSAIFQLRSLALDLVFERRRDRSLLGRALSRRGAAEGWWINRHQDLGDLLQCLHPDSFPALPSLDRAVEAALNLADFAGRLAGGNISDRPRFFRRVLEITVGESWEIGREAGGSHRARAGALTDRIREVFEHLARQP